MKSSALVALTVHGIPKPGLIEITLPCPWPLSVPN